MTTLSIGLVIIYVALVTNIYAGCPVDYVCKWDSGVYVLHCNPVVHNSTELHIISTITDLPVTATRVKIKCFSQSIVVRLSFTHVPHVRELTLDTFSVTSLYVQVFSGLERITKLTLRNLLWRRLEKHTFSGLTQLRSLFVEQLPDLEYMDSAVLVPLESLESLSFKYVGANNDRLEYSDYAAILRNQSFNLLRLVMYAVHSENNPETNLNIDTLLNNGLSSRTLRYLELGRNNIVKMEGNPARSWPMLEYISLAENFLLGATQLVSFWMQFYTHRTLRTIDLSRINERALNSGAASFQLTVDEHCPKGVHVIIGPRVQSISLRYTTFIANSQTSHYPLCFLDRNNAMHYVDLSHARSTTHLSFSPMSIHGLRYFNIQNVNTRNLTVTTFSHMPNLTMLLLGQNNIGSSIANDSNNSLFANNTKLRLLDLSECQITTIPAEEFSHLHQLQILNLSFNDMTNFTVKLDQLTALTLLNISHNRLTTLSPTTTKELDEMTAQGTIQVDISGNPLLCFQNQTTFVTWVETTNVKFVNKENTYCVGENGSQTMYFGVETKIIEGSTEIIEREKANNGWKYGVGISFSVIGVSIPFAIYVWFRCRWKCAFLCQKVKRVVHNNDATNTQTFKRDAFICYNSKDSSWVCQDLLHQLEARQISTVIHHRDFLPGSVLEETIRDSIDMSRYTVLVLSPDFLSSNWCLLEMHLARSRIISEGRDVIVPIILRDFPFSLLTKTLEGILSKSYLEWTEDPDERAMFWDKLTTKLKQGGNIKPLQK